LSQAEAIGYAKSDLEPIPKEAILGLGCGSPTAVASLKKGRWFWTWFQGPALMSSSRRPKLARREESLAST